ncbi:MAG: glycerol-3-phosphate 1-O-acyltransferase PlsY [Candidatus Bipolaricaulia bacterium]
MILLEGLLAAIIFYALGAIPFSYLIVRLVKGVDIRDYGSGNVGATNVGRVLGWRYHLLALALDLGKGLAAAALALHWDLPILLAGLAVVGHDWSIFLRFSGGKGVATSLGVLAVLSWPALLIALAIWGLLAWRTRFVSIASMGALLYAPLFIWLFNRDLWATVLMLALALLAIYRHRGNIARLRRGEGETRL